MARNHHAHVGLAFWALLVVAGCGGRGVSLDQRGGSNTVTNPVGGNTVEVFLKEDDPVKLIVVAETVVAGGSDPIVEIAGRTDTATGQKGDIRIANLVLKEVEADRLEVKETEVVRFDSSNVAAKDDELDVEVEPVNVVRAGRGGTTVLAVGINRDDLDLSSLGDGAEMDALLRTLGKARPSGARVDRIRVLGPEGKSAFVENLIVLRSSVFGKIQIKDVKIQHLVLDTVTLDDLTSASP